MQSLGVPPALLAACAIIQAVLLSLAGSIRRGLQSTAADGVGLNTWPRRRSVIGALPGDRHIPVFEVQRTFEPIARHLLDEAAPLLQFKCVAPGSNPRSDILKGGILSSIAALLLYLYDYKIHRYKNNFSQALAKSKNVQKLEALVFEIHSEERLQPKQPFVFHEFLFKIQSR